MNKQAVTNASPLIFLSRSGLLELMQTIAPTIMVPEAVAAEIQQRGSVDPTAQAIATTSWLNIVPAIPIPSKILSWGLGIGESSVLAWAYNNPNAEAILDDLAARRCAAVLGIPVRGTLGIVLLAKQEGQIPTARTVLMQLRQGGMYLSDQVMNQALTLVGE